MRKFIAICLFLISALPLVAQGTAPALKLPRVSQHMVSTATVGLTDITVDYSRPSVKGRAIWGGLVPYDQVWRTGANEATQITFSDDVTINGQPLPKGTYSLHTIPGKDSWTIIFNKVQPVFHTMYPSGQDVLRVTAAPRKGEHMETLAFYFPVVDGRKAELVIHWGTVVVPLAIEVP